jgi:hypothetical protein
VWRLSSAYAKRLTPFLMKSYLFKGEFEASRETKKLGILRRSALIGLTNISSDITSW